MKNLLHHPIFRRLENAVDTWIAMSMGSNSSPWGNEPDTDCNATILLQNTTL